MPEPSEKDYIRAMGHVETLLEMNRAERRKQKCRLSIKKLHAELEYLESFVYKEVA